MISNQLFASSDRQIKIEKEMEMQPSLTGGLDLSDASVNLLSEASSATRINNPVRAEGVRGVEEDQDDNEDDDGQDAVSGSGETEHSLLGELQPVSRKRHNDKPREYRTRKKRRAPRFAYVELLNSEIEDAIVMQDGQIRRWKDISKDGATPGIFAETKQLFDQLSRCRPNTVREMRSTFPSNSDVEILSFQHQLKKSANEQEFHGEAARNIVSATKFLPACEISQTCGDALEEEADMVSSFQWQHEKNEEEARFGEYALLTADNMQELNVSLGLTDAHDLNGQAEGPGSSYDVDDTVKESIYLLNLGNWLELSERIFMNVRMPDEAHIPFATVDDIERPGIFATAFVDFSNLARNITRRLVSATILHATSRLRATDIADGSRRMPYARKRDVYSALDVLSLKSDSRNFWRGAARRLGLDIYQGRLPTPQKYTPGHYISYDDPLSYDEVERCLDNSLNDTSENIAQARFQHEHEIFELAHDSTSPNVDSEDYLTNDQSESNEDTKDMEDGNEQQLEHQDRLFSSAEEVRMWHIVTNKSAARSGTWQVKTTDKTEGHKTPQEDMKDWKACVDFRADWERYGQHLPRETFPMLKGEG